MLHPRIETVQLFGNSRLEGLFACDRHQVVRALDERLSSDVIFTFTLRGVELGVIRSTRRFVDQAAFNPAHEQIVVDFEFKRRVELLFSLLEQVIKLLTPDETCGIKMAVRALPFLLESRCAGIHPTGNRPHKQACRGYP